MTKKGKLLPREQAVAAITEHLVRLEGATRHAVLQELCVVLIEQLHERGQADAALIAQALVERMSDPLVLASFPQAAAMAEVAAGRLREVAHRADRADGDTPPPR